MYVACSGVAKLRITETGETLTVNPDELDWDNEGVGERGMGDELRHWATVELVSPKTGNTYHATWELWEYPIGVENNSELELDSALELIEDFDYHLAHEPEVDEDDSSLNTDRQFFSFGEPLSGGIRLSGNAELTSESDTEGNSKPVTPAPHALSTLTSVCIERLAEQDYLERTHITEALRLLITERDSDQHFALGLFGDWGSGKSSLIHQLTEQLKANHPKVMVAEFNAWKNEKASNLGAMLAQSVVECLTADLSFFDQLRLAVKLIEKRNTSLRKSIAKDVGSLKSKGDKLFPWLLVAIPPLLSVAVMTLLLLALPVPGVEWFKWVLGPLAAISSIYLTLSGFLHKNLTEQFKQVDRHKILNHLKLPNFSEHRGLFGEIHRTLGHLCALRLGEKGAVSDKVLLLVIDDLDRCGINAVKDIFDAVRLVADIPHLITLVAIDEQMAFAAVEKHYDQFGATDRPPAKIAREYLAKVLQTSIKLPEIQDTDIERFVEDSLFSEIGKDRQKSTHESTTGESTSQPITPNANSVLDSAYPSVNTSAEDSRAQTIAIPLQSALVEEMRLFQTLAIIYSFRNPRLMGRLHLSWRLLKALYFRGKAYRFEQIETNMRLLFWREYCLQQDAESRPKLDDWLASGCKPGGPQHLVEGLGTLPTSMINTVMMGQSVKRSLELIDAVLLPASSYNQKKTADSLNPAPASATPPHA
ncbi:MAG TPA: P-loop NTPase fold protein [Rhodocyclaceae bacterium]|jgi:hypothetical protein